EINMGKFPVNTKSVHLTVDKFVKIFKISDINFNSPPQSPPVTAASIKKIKELSIAFVSNEDIKKLNKIYRGINKPTDVLSFGNLKNHSPLSQRGGRGDFSDVGIRKSNLNVEAHNDYAEIIISYPKAKEQAKYAGWNISDEIRKLLVHALLHLIGYDHITEKQAKEMEEMEEKFQMLK
ncbi:MAG: rRNA maturation RNase YbeY, partial [bacterium]